MLSGILLLTMAPLESGVRNHHELERGTEWLV